MKLINPSFEILEQKNLYTHIELCGRTCYKSTDKITSQSAKPFIDRLIKSQHYAMLEHGTVYMKIPCDIFHRWTHPNLCKKYLSNKYTKCQQINEYEEDCLMNPIPKEYLYVTTNLRVLVENGWLKDLKYECRPTDFHYKRITVKFICNRQVSHEFVRHKLLCAA